MFKVGDRVTIVNVGHVRPTLLGLSGTVAAVHQANDVRRALFSVAVDGHTLGLMAFHEEEIAPGAEESEPCLTTPQVL